MRVRSFFRRFSISKVGFAACILVFAGILLGSAVHVGFFFLFALGAFGPGLLREVGVLHDLDDLQRASSIRAGYRAYLAGGFFLVAAVLVRRWGRGLDLGDDFVPASLVLCLMLVVSVLAYALSFWDARQAASFVLLAFGLFWTAFVVLSHAGEPAALLVEGAAVAVPFLLGAFLSRRWPRVAGVLVLAVACGLTYFFHLYQVVATERLLIQRLFVALLIPLPLAVIGVALLLPRTETRNTGE